MAVPTDAVLDGDELLELRWPGGGNTSWRGLFVRNGTVYRPDGSVWGSPASLQYPPGYWFLVRRAGLGIVAAPPVNATFTVPAGRASRTIPDWPLPCPRCGKANSAVTLFSTTECRWGCFSGKAMLQ